MPRNRQSARAARLARLARSVPSHFRVKISQHGRATVLAAIGELDLASGPALEQALERAQAAELIIVDLRSLQFIDSTGLSVLIRASQRAQAAGRRFALVNGGSQVQRLLSLTGVTDRLMVVDTPEELLGES
jgi:anti-anti-sigma factor